MLDHKLAASARFASGIWGGLLGFEGSKHMVRVILHHKIVTRSAPRVAEKPLFIGASLNGHPLFPHVSTVNGSRNSPKTWGKTRGLCSPGVLPKACQDQRKRRLGERRRHYLRRDGPAFASGHSHISREREPRRCLIAIWSAAGAVSWAGAF
jgi:hypothetical protein